MYTILQAAVQVQIFLMEMRKEPPYYWESLLNLEGYITSTVIDKAASIFRKQFGKEWAVLRVVNRNWNLIPYLTSGNL